MRNDELVLGATQAYELQASLRKAGYTDGELKALSGTPFLSKVLTVIRGQATIQALPPAEQAPVTPFEPKVFKTIKLGEHKSHKDYRKAMEKAGFRIGDYAVQILEKVTVASEPTELDLVVVTVGELGFKDGARRDAIYEKALSLGLQLCPNEVGPALRLAHPDQPMNEWLRVGMEPLTDSGGGLYVFCVDHDGNGRWLDSYYGEPDLVWNAVNRWVFVQPRK